MYARLTPAEQAEVDKWVKPTSFVLDADHGVVFEYDASQRELAVGLDSAGNYCDPESPECVTPGHLDCAQVFDYDGKRVCVVVDLKRSERTSEVDSLQLQAYLLAYAGLHNCDQGVVGIWNLTDSEWIWGEWVDLGPFSDEADRMRERVMAAAVNTSDATTNYSHGPHCRGCYGRSKCPAHLMPLELAHTSLAPFCIPGGVESLTPVERGEILLKVKQAEDTLEIVKEAMKTAAFNGYVVSDGQGKVYKRISVKGRAGFDSKALEVDEPQLFQKYVKLGKPSEQYRWCKE
jgi:hypothetical protein